MPDRCPRGGIHGAHMVNSLLIIPLKLKPGTNSIFQSLR
jgi:hypothetical protein